LHVTGPFRVMQGNAILPCDEAVGVGITLNSRGETGVGKNGCTGYLPPWGRSMAYCLED
jgi:hypothetical protein